MIMSKRAMMMSMRTIHITTGETIDVSIQRSTMMMSKRGK